MKIGASRTFKVSNIASFQTGLHKMARQEGIGIRTMKISDNEVVVARVSGEAEEEKAA